MPALLVVVVILLVLAAMVLAIPLSLVRRYRVGTARRAARGWVSTVNIVSLCISAVFLLSGAMITNIWVSRAFLYALGGLIGGGLLGMVGLALTRWEVSHRSIHYTPSKLLVGGILLLVISRIAFSFWRSWVIWQSEQGEFAWLAASGAAASIGAGAIIVGYYIVYFLGVRRRAVRHRGSTGGR